MYPVNWGVLRGIKKRAQTHPLPVRARPEARVNPDESEEGGGIVMGIFVRAIEPERYPTRKTPRRVLRYALT